MNIPPDSDFHKTLHRTLTTSTAPGMSAAVFRNGQPLVIAAAGFRDLEKTAALDPGARFYIYSVTKSLIASVILMLVEQGCLALDSPVQDYLPGLVLEHTVTLRQLLNHTGGIPDYGGMASYDAAIKAGPARPWTSEDFLANTLSKGFDFLPGQGWNYSNIGYLLLRRVIETTLQATLDSALRQFIFDPVGLSHPQTAATLEDAAQLTPGYSDFFTTGSLQDVHEVYHPGWVSHGVVIATAAELARAFDAIFHGPLLRPESRAAMLEPIDVAVQHPFFQRPAYGLGLMIDRESRYGVIAAHGGGGPGYSAGAVHIPDAHGQYITSAVLMNSDKEDLALRTAFDLAVQAGEGGAL